MLNDLRDTFGFKIPELFPKGGGDPLTLVSSCDCEFWFDGQDASTFSLNGVNVIQWDDKSGFGRHVSNPVDAARPSYDVATGRVDFVGANSDYLRSADFAAALIQPNTIFILYKITGALDVTKGIFDGRLTANRNSFFNIASVFNISAGVQLGLDATNANDNIHIGEFNGANSNFWINGILSQNGNAGVKPLDDVTLGALFNLSSHADVEIMEVFGYNCVITDAERNALNAYLTTKWEL